MVYLDRLEKLKEDCEKLARYTKLTDQLGFKMTQNISGLIFQIENGIFTMRDILTLERRFNHYCNEWFENLRDNCEIIRKFSLERAREIDTDLKNVERDARTLRTTFTGMNNQTKSNQRIWYVSSIKRIARRLAKISDKCKMDRITIKQIIDEISETLQ